MTALHAMESWMDDRQSGPAKKAPGVVGFPAAAAAGAVSPLSMEQRFEVEAMPHLNDIFRTATRILGERGRAEDVAQEVYLQAWKSFHRFETGTNCRAWLFKILFHCVNHHRRKWFRFPVLKEAQEFMEANLTAPAEIPEQLSDEDILTALDRISADFRAVVMLVDVEEFAYKEAAEILAIPIGTVMSRLSRGRKLLREQLADVAKSYGIGAAAQEGKEA
ncbi:MAG: sigma-70 family RNA polymerase sigma factor [Bryobacteraceae bacterium]